MIIELFAFLVVLCLVLIIIGLTRPTESAQALIGFFLLFLLSLVILSGNLQYETGMVANVTGLTNGTGQMSTISTTYLYSAYNDDTTHNIGYFLAIASSIGFIGVLYGLRKGMSQK